MANNDDEARKARIKRTAEELQKAYDKDKADKAEAKRALKEKIFQEQLVSTAQNPALNNSLNQQQQEQWNAKAKYAKNPNLIQNISKIYKKYAGREEEREEKSSREDRRELLRQAKIEQIKQSHAKTIERMDTREERAAQVQELRRIAADKSVDIGERAAALEKLKSEHGIVARTYEQPTPTERKGFFGSLGFGKTKSLTKPGPDKGADLGPRGGNKYTYFRSGPNAGRIKGVSNRYKEFAKEVYGKEWKQLSKEERKELASYDYRFGKVGTKNEGIVQRKPISKYERLAPTSFRKFKRGMPISTGKKTKAAFTKFGKSLEPKYKESDFEKKRQQFYQQQYQSYMGGGQVPNLNIALKFNQQTNSALTSYNRQLQQSNYEHQANLQAHRDKVALINFQTKQRAENMKSANVINAESFINHNKNQMMFNADGKKLGIDLFQNTFSNEPENNIMMKHENSIDLFQYAKTHPNILSPQPNNILSTPSLTFFGNNNNQNQQQEQQ